MTHAPHTHPPTDSPLVAAIVEARRAGSSPKEISRMLDVRPSIVSEVVRALAREAEPTAAADEPDAVRCWVNGGWHAELIVDGHPEWPRGKAGSDGGYGLATVVVARPQASDNVSACTFLVDTQCLGVKDTVGPLIMSRSKLARFVGAVFGAYGRPGLEVPLHLASQLVFGAVEYARTLGFEPHVDYRRCAGHLGAWNGDCAIRFGRLGKPMYVSGPRDDVARVLRRLDRSVGREGYDFIVPAEVGLSVLSG